MAATSLPRTTSLGNHPRPQADPDDEREHPQLPLARTPYHDTSLGASPVQMMRYRAKAMYAQNMTKVSGN
jgi:hypothetical protein